MNIRACSLLLDTPRIFFTNLESDFDDVDFFLDPGELIIHAVWWYRGGGGLPAGLKIFAHVILLTSKKCISLCRDPFALIPPNIIICCLPLLHPSSTLALFS